MAEGLIRQHADLKTVHAKDIDRVMSLCAPNIVSGATEIQPMDMFHGANSASVRDPFGHVCLPGTSAHGETARRVVRQSQNLEATK